MLGLPGVEVQNLVDVRLNAISRKTGFSKRALREALAARGIEYLHLRDLGDPKTSREGFWDPGSPQARRCHGTCRRALREPEAEAALDVLLRLTEQRRPAMLCFECGRATGHRHLIADRLEQMSLQAA